MIKFQIGKKYEKEEIADIISTSQDEKNKIFKRYDFRQSGYADINDNLIVFANLNYKGKAGLIFPNKYDEENKILIWHTKKNTHSGQPQVQKIIDGSTTPYIFVRNEENSPWEYLGVGIVLKYKDGVEVADKDKKLHRCVGFTLNIENTKEQININNDDSFYEDTINTGSFEGKIKYKKHKTRERDKSIVKKKKRHFKQIHGKLFCEACGFSFGRNYGDRAFKKGEEFIECHHNIPLHEEDTRRLTRLSDLSLLCANCHRMVHTKSPWLTIDELKVILGTQ